MASGQQAVGAANRPASTAPILDRTVSQGHCPAVNKTPDLFPANSITPLEWDWIQELIQEAQRQALREAFASSEAESSVA